jgi:hypothetical protein
MVEMEMVVVEEEVKLELEMVVLEEEVRKELEMVEVALALAGNRDGGAGGRGFGWKQRWWCWRKRLWLEPEMVVVDKVKLELELLEVALDGAGDGGS